MIVERTCTEIQNGKREAGRTSVLLKDYRDTPAYVLLGDPGDGKTTAFKSEQVDGLEIDVPASAEAFLEPAVDSDVAS